MGKVGQYLGEHAATNAVKTLADIVLVDPTFVLLMEGAFPLSALIPDHINQIGRPTSIMDGFVLPQSLDDCYQAGRVQAGRVISRYGHLRAIVYWMLESEPPASEAERWGAFGAGAADTFGRFGRVYVAGNWSYGVPEAPDFVRYWRRLHAMRQTDAPMVLGYHGYTKGNPDDAQYLEQRPWTMWRPALEAVGLSLPNTIVMTEAGYDCETYPNGYRHHWTSEQYADYLQKLPELVPECAGFVVFGYGMTDDWGLEQKGFDFAGDATVLAGMAAAKGEELVPTDDLAHVIWDDAYRWQDKPKPKGFNPETAIGAFIEKAPGDTGAALTDEFDDPTGRFRCVKCALSLVISDKKNWFTDCAANEEELLEILTRWGYYPKV